MDTPTVQIPGFSYNAGKTDIGSGYAAGISEAGKGVAAGLHDVLDVMTQNRNTDDTLMAMKQSNILSDDAYKAIAGKSLGAKQQMLGLYAGQWIADQAAARQAALARGEAGNKITVQHAGFLDQMAAASGKYGPPGQIAAGVTPQKAIVTPQQPVRRAQPVTTQRPPATAPVAAPPNTSGSPTPSYVQMGPSPNVQLQKVGPPLNLSEPAPPGSQIRQIRGPKGDIIDGVLLPDGTFRPRPVQ